MLAYGASGKCAPRAWIDSWSFKCGEALYAAQCGTLTYFSQDPGTTRGKEQGDVLPAAARGEFEHPA